MSTLFVVADNLGYFPTAAPPYLVVPGYIVCAPFGPTGPDVFGFEVSPDGAKVYCATYNGTAGVQLTRTDIATATIDWTVTIGASLNAPGGIHVSPDGGHVYVLCGTNVPPTATMFAVNTTTLTVHSLGTVNLDVQDGFAMRADGNRMWGPVGGVLQEWTPSGIGSSVTIPVAGGYSALAGTPEFDATGRYLWLQYQEEPVGGPAPVVLARYDTVLNVWLQVVGPTTAYERPGGIQFNSTKSTLMVLWQPTVGLYSYQTCNPTTQALGPLYSAGGDEVIDTVVPDPTDATTVGLVETNFFTGNPLALIHPLTASSALSVSAYSSTPSHAASTSRDWAPTFDFTWDIFGLTVDFADENVMTPPGTSIVPGSQEWTFGDGGVGTGDTVTHAYAFAGTYTVSLTIQNTAGLEVIVKHTITVPPVPTVLRVVPDHGPVAGGNSVTVYGTGFTPTGTVSVEFGFNFATSVVVISSTELTCVVPPSSSGGPQTVNVTVGTLGGYGTLVRGYTYGAVPTRQFPRDDHLGLGAVRQRVGRGQPTSLQNSYRQGSRGTYP